MRSTSTSRSSFSREKTVSRRRCSLDGAVGSTDRRISARSRIGEAVSPASRRISSPRAWNVLTRTGAGASGIAVPSLAVSSSAARLLNVTAVILEGSVPSAISHAILATRVVVLPLPESATHPMLRRWRSGAEQSPTDSENKARTTLNQALSLDVTQSPAPSIGMRIYMSSARPTPVGRARTHVLFIAPRPRSSVSA